MIDVIAWAVALGVGLVIAAFCGYEIRWKAARLRGDLAELRAMIAQVEALRANRETAATRRSPPTGP